VSCNLRTVEFLWMILRVCYLRVHIKCRSDPVNLENVRKNKIKDMKQSSQSACVVIPATVFHISEEPLHEFLGHCGDVLNLSWSNNKVS
jgi:hypothetical protein